MSIKMVLENNGIKVPKIHSDTMSNNKQMYVYGKENIGKFKNFIYKDSTICLSRKLDKFYYVENCKELKLIVNHFAQVKPSKIGKGLTANTEVNN